MSLLTYLSVGFNTLPALPPSLAQLSQLVFLDIRQLGISTLPPWIGQLQVHCAGTWPRAPPGLTCGIRTAGAHGTGSEYQQDRSAPKIDQLSFKAQVPVRGQAEEWLCASSGADANGPGDLRDLSFNSLSAIPKEAFRATRQLTYLR